MGGNTYGVYIERPKITVNEANLEGWDISSVFSEAGKESKCTVGVRSMTVLSCRNASKLAAWIISMVTRESWIVVTVASAVERLGPDIQSHHLAWYSGSWPNMHERGSPEVPVRICISHSCIPRVGGILCFVLRSFISGKKVPVIFNVPLSLVFWYNAALCRVFFSLCYGHHHLSPVFLSFLSNVNLCSLEQKAEATTCSLALGTL